MPPELFEHRAAGEIGKGAAGRPDEVVDADHPLQAGPRLALADHRLERRPGKAHANIAKRRHQQVAGDSLHPAAGQQDPGHDAEPDSQREKTAPTLREPAAENRRKSVDAAECSSKDQVFFPVKSEPLLHEKVYVVKIIRRGDGVQA